MKRHTPRLVYTVMVRVAAVFTLTIVVLVVALLLIGHSNNTCDDDDDDAGSTLTSDLWPIYTVNQWRRQDLLRGGAKLEIRSWSTRGELQGRLQQLIDD